MLELNFFNFMLISLLFIIFLIIYSYLPKPHQISSKIPSVTNGFWNTIQFSWIMAMKQPKGEYKNDIFIHEYDNL